MRTAVVAIGGNALIGLGEHGTSSEELAHARVFARHVAGMVADGWSVVITHGNGPQVGFVLRRSELTAGVDRSLPPMTLDHCVAETQGGLGYLLALALSNELTARRLPQRVAAVVTRVVVDPMDPGLAVPTKPIGGFYSADASRRLSGELSWTMAVDPAGRGHRRVVPSPDPTAIDEAEAIRALIESDHIVIAGGGGGVPVTRDAAGIERGIEAVIDKDLTSGLLAVDLRADLLLLCTDVDAVALDFAKPTQRWLDRLDAATADRYLAEGQFPPGSMGPKVRAAVSFARAAAGWGEAVITSIERIPGALVGTAGTRVVPEPVLAPT